jgi:hypothetical protein
MFIVKKFSSLHFCTGCLLGKFKNENSEIPALASISYELQSATESGKAYLVCFVNERLLVSA